ncbi:Quinoprotein glucose dehydrogenase [Delftia tsuruhatensis]|uniref:membrane-bound PQQ-dependent dehydrogenase, glucose/quinate/shikimate family n=1 Tax=Delftia tsuruhatensis TaxID=180282 RepID=UPI001E7A742F|nr:membrane-bound PQQ-dependent dehydrogenase, glucose/quinate/shikimate family [Delftia tsuruhatensis]CAB5718684.1 Quinoprotein glucose dehydrogenase [Delftia tsuruhatensis]CAC9676136.1 Quinoprotein glucose dehydrogenase [Delftia tsuruhatensis]
MTAWRWLMALLLWGAGAWLAWGGAQLLLAGGSSYYLIAGLLILVTGLGMARRSALALWLFALCLLGTALWAVWETGMDWWPLAARLGWPWLIGLLLVLPWSVRALRHEPDMGQNRGLAPAHAALAMVVLGTAVLAGLSFARQRDAHETDGRFAGPAAASSDLPADGQVTAVQNMSMVAAESGALRSPPVLRGEAADAVPDGEWHAYGRTGAGQRYSPLRQIGTHNARLLQLAWEFRTGDVRGKPGDPEETTFEVTPLKIGERLFLCTPHQSVIALEATTGKLLWRRDLPMPKGLALQHLTCRGLSYQSAQAAAQFDAAAGQAFSAVPPARGVPVKKGGGPDMATSQQPEARPSDDASRCSAKLFMATADGKVVALDPADGKTCGNVAGGLGYIDLWQGMPQRKPGAYYSTSPVVVARDRIIVGGTVLDNHSTREPSGVIRAFDIRSGRLLWAWDPGRPDSSTPLPEGQTYVPSSPNSWSVSSVDEALGLVYVPMGNAPPDQWGGRRSAEAEQFSSSVVALDVATGAVRWVFQTVHHDLWDYDVPAQPSLIDLEIGGQSVPALVQPTKQGELFVLDRRTGQPLLPVSEVAAPQGAARGDRTATTQPHSLLSFNPPALTERDMWGATPFEQLWCRLAFRRLRYEGRFTPPSEQGSLIYPGNFGVFNWGGVAVDPRRQVVFATPTRLAFVSTLVPRSDDHSLRVQDGGPPKDGLPALNENFGAPFAVRLKPFVSPLGIPCQAPPWGFVAGADLRTGRIAWQRRNGTPRDLSPLPLGFRMGVPGIGGPLMTAGGVAFYSGALDNYVRAYDVDSGRQLWQDRLPAGGQATPMTYLGTDQRQYLLVVAGGHGSTGTKAGDSVRAYVLPKEVTAP